LLVPFLSKVLQDVCYLAHNVRALGFASSVAEAIELAAKYLSLLGVQRLGPS
jgi:hypothetical protein